MGPRRGALWVWLPLALPALPLVSGQYRVALWLGIDGQYAAVLWSHLLWVLPWMLLILQPAAAHRSAASPHGQNAWLAADKSLLPDQMSPAVAPRAAGVATGFSVSMAQYMPTLWLGAGRFSTLTTETVALSSGGSIPILANRALWLLLVTGVVFGVAALLSRLAGHYRRGLR